MIKTIISLSIRYRIWVLLIVGAFTLWGVWAIKTTPIDALPDLSDVQVIVRTTYPGQAPQLIENQITYPLTTTMMSVPGVKTVRGYSFFGDSFVYILFDDQTDLYWARSRVLEYLNQVQARLPATSKSVLGPDATGVGWIYQYALVDHSGKQDIASLRALQDWFLKPELKTVSNVAEVATVGGMVKQYQVVLDPQKLVQFRLSQSQVVAAIQRANQETGGSVVELSNTEYMVRAHGYLTTLDSFNQIPLMTSASGVVVSLQDVARVQLGPETRRAITELDGEGEVVGGVILLRAGKDTLTTIEAVKTKLASLSKSLPSGVDIVTTYDRSSLIHRALQNLREKIIEELIVVAIVCLLFLWHIRSALVAIISLPIGILLAFIVMRYQGINANIMSLGGIAIAIGAMIDAAIVMIENAHKHIEAWQTEHPQETLDASTRWQIITQSAIQVGPALFFSLLIITLSFIPIFSLQAQEGKLFSPLAFTKTYAMAIAAILSITLIPVLMGYWIKGKIPAEQKNPLNHFLISVYKPVLNAVLNFPKTTLIIALLSIATLIYPLSRMGGEFMPALDEGDVLYMPSALPGLSIGKARELLQRTDQLIKTVPEVARVFGKAGRAETATDPAPIEMMETTIQFKPRDQWRAGMTPEKLIAELDRVVKVPELTNVWVPPIRNRIDMLATGIKSPIGIKVSGANLQDIESASLAIEKVAKTVSGVSSAFAERLTGGHYIDINPDRQKAALAGLNIQDINEAVATLMGGENIGEIIDGTARYPINVRYPSDWRDSVDAVRQLPVVTKEGQHITLGDIATVEMTEGPAMLRSENARLSNWVYIDVQQRDLSSVVHDLQKAITRHVQLPQGVSINYAGQFEFLERAMARLQWVVPITLFIIGVLLYFIFKRFSEVLIVMLTLPFSLIGGIWLTYLLGYHFSVAIGVGFIALAGIAAEFGVVMLLYLRTAVEKRIAQGMSITPMMVRDAIYEGAVLRVRPKAMTVSVILAGLLPIMFGVGTGSEVMRRIAAPMIGGMLTAPLLSMLIIPSLYFWVCLRGRH